MPVIKEPRRFWLDEDSDALMEDEHGFIWSAMAAAVDVDLADTRVLDVGCNRGGFLRLLADAHGISEGFGYDPADAAVDIATELADGRPLRFAAADAPPDGWSAFDVAFSHEVLYLVHDLDGHARDMHRILRAGGVYYVVMGTHERNPMMPSWHREFSQRMAMPPIYSLEDVVATFVDAGFVSSVRRMPYGFIPTDGHLDGGLEGWLDYYYRHKVMLRFAKP